jgi:hypothetical protein
MKLRSISSEVVHDVKGCYIPKYRIRTFWGAMNISKNTWKSNSDL